MSRPMQLKNIGLQQIATAAAPITTSLLSTVFSPTFPAGDLEIYEFYLRAYGNQNLTASVTGTVGTNGPEKFIRGITLETDKHGKILDGIDGLGLHRINQLRFQTEGKRLDVTSAATGNTDPFETNFILPMASWGGLRPYDTILDLFKARPTLTVNTGINTDLVYGGTYSVQQIQTFNVQLGARILNGPIVEPGSVDANKNPMLPETPEWMPHWQVKKVDTLTTNAGQLIDLPWGDRIIRRIYISQRDISTTNQTGGNELNNTVLTSTANIGLLVNSFPWGDRNQNGAIQAYNKQKFQVESMPNGWTVLDFDETDRYPDMLSVLSQNAGYVQLQLDVTGVASSQIWIYIESYKPIPDAALRASQLALRQAANA